MPEPCQRGRDGSSCVDERYQKAPLDGLTIHQPTLLPENSCRCGRPAGDVIEFVATGDGYRRIAGTAGDEEIR